MLEPFDSGYYDVSLKTPHRTIRHCQRNELEKTYMAEHPHPLAIRNPLSITSFFIFLLFVMACGTKHMTGSPMADMEKAEAAGAYRMMDSYAEMAPAPMKSMKLSDTRNEPKPAKRMVHYNGYGKMKSPRPVELIAQAKDIVIASGGYVEHIRENSAGFRVPVKTFSETFKKILSLGTVISKNISASDVTDSFNDMDLKLKIAKASRNRYLELLNKTDDEAEKLALLKEIGRLNESIEAMESMLKTLGTLADFSRISLDVTGISTDPVSDETKDIFEFQWIHDLSPFSRSSLENGSRIAFETPRDMVHLGGKNWITESADGVVFFAYRRPNHPSGDSRFWADAIKTRIGKAFKSSGEFSEGAFTCLRWESLSDKPYVYVLGLYAHDGYLDLVEMYFPTLDHEKQFKDRIADVLKKGSK